MNTFKKIIAAVMAMTSLAISATGVLASATDVTMPATLEVAGTYSVPTGYVYFGKGAKAGIYRDSSQVVISTKWNSGTTVYVELVSTGGASASRVKTKYGYDEYASLNFLGSGFTHAESYHEAGGYSANLSR